MDHPGFDLLKEAFKKFASKQDAEDLTGKLVRSAAAGGKAAVDKALEEFPKAFVRELATDFYAMVASQEVADGISMTVRSFDEEKVKGLLDSVMTQLKEDDNALKVAKSLKGALDKSSTEDLENAVEGLLSSRSMGERWVVKAFFEQAKPYIEEMRGASEEEIAEKVKELADTIPADAIAQQVADLTREVTPERVSRQAHDMVRKLPSPGAVSDIVHSLGNAASDKLGRMTIAASLEDAKAILQEFAADAQDIVRNTIANDDVAKKTFNKKDGKDFSL